MLLWCHLIAPLVLVVSIPKPPADGRPPAGGGKGADYSIPGNTINRVMNGFNALGIVAFC